MNPNTTSNEQRPWLEDGGEAGAIVRSIDWAKTPLGAIDTWPASLKALVGMVLHAEHPMLLWWGSELRQFYNDSYIPSLGAKHPAAMGERGDGKPIEAEDQLVSIVRNGRIEDVYWTYSYSPVFDESESVAGMLVVCTETTSRVLAERRHRAVQLLAKQTSLATTHDEVLNALRALFDETKDDVPFVLVYAVDERGELIIRSSIGMTEDRTRAIDTMVRPLLSTAASQAPVAIDASSCAYVASIDDGKNTRVGYAVFGLSPRRAFDDAYRAFLQQLIDQVSMARRRIEIDRTKQALVEERNSLLLQAPIATALLRGPTHIFEVVNPLFCRMVNRTDLVGKAYVEAFPEVATSSLPAVLDNVYRTGQPFFSGKMLVPIDKRGNGTLEDCFFTFNLEALRNATGQVYGMMAVALEITDLVKARQATEKAQQEHEGLLVEAQQASRAKDEFFAMLGHELRNPLAPIVTALHLMRQHSSGAASREQQIIERQVGHLVRLVDDLLDVSKIARGKIVLKKEGVDIHDVVANAVEIVSDLFEEHRHRLSLDVPDSGASVTGDPVRLVQVVANLLTNAARYTEPGGNISVHAKREDEDIVLTVKDNGTGIDAELLPRIFDLFVQGRRNTDRKEGGLGLGLALVRSLVTMHGGAVVARSEGIGHGSEFEIRLPARENKAIRSTRTPNKDFRTRPISKRILVVDDNVDSAEMMRAMLESIGHVVALAHDGPEALTVAAEFVPDVALLDIGLPVMDGYELGRRLLTAEPTLKCRLIALTGYGQEHDRAQSKASGFEAHLVKPVDMHDLLDLISAS